MLNNPFGRLNVQQNTRRLVLYGEYEPAILTTVKDLNYHSKMIQNISRGGCIYYTFINDKLYICMGRDKETGDLTDFGGKKLKFKNENIIQCAIREGNEETNCAFGHFSIENIYFFKLLYNSYMLIIFIPVLTDEKKKIFFKLHLIISEKNL